MSTTARIGWAALIVATLYVCYFSHLGAIGFVGPDEPRYAWVAREMVESGDWVTPRLYGKPWFEKPPLYYWGAAACFKLFGVNEAAARLPSAISALLATLALAWLAWQVYGGETARWLLLLLPTTVGMIGFSHAAATDMPFSGMLTLAMVCAAVIVGLVPEESCRDGAQNAAPLPKTRVARRRSVALILFGFFLGLAVLAKGPAAIILCGGAVFFWVVFTKRWRDGVRLLHPVGIAASCITALPWYVHCARRNPDFFRVFIIEHNFKRFLTPEFQHIQAFWFYVPVLLIAFLPWTSALVWTASAAAFQMYKDRLHHGTSFLLSWSLFCVLFFSISQSKLPGYVLPAVPAIAALLSYSCTYSPVLKARSFGVTLLVVAFLFLPLAIWVWQSGERPLGKLVAFEPIAALVLILLALFGILLASGFLVVGSEKRFLFLFSGVLCLILPLAFAGRILKRTPVEILSADYLARQIRNAQIRIEDLKISAIKRDTRFGLDFYLHTELSDWDRDPHREVYVLAEGQLPCRQQPKEMLCTDLWDQDRIDAFRLLHLVPRGLSVAGGGKVK